MKFNRNQTRRIRERLRKFNEKLKLWEQFNESRNWRGLEKPDVPRFAGRFGAVLST